MLGKITTKLLDQCFFMKALRASAGKAVLLGMLDAVQNQASLEELDGELSDKDTDGAPPQSPPVSITLPKPQLLSRLEKHSPESEPDRPGVPPKRLRKNRVSEGREDSGSEADAGAKGGGE